MATTVDGDNTSSSSHLADVSDSSANKPKRDHSNGGGGDEDGEIADSPSKHSNPSNHSTSNGGAHSASNGEVKEASSSASSAPSASSSSSSSNRRSRSGSKNRSKRRSSRSRSRGRAKKRSSRSRSRSRSRDRSDRRSGAGGGGGGGGGGRKRKSSRDRDRSGSSGRSHKRKRSGSRDRQREKEREQREKEREKEREQRREKDREREQRRDKEKEKEKEREAARGGAADTKRRSRDRNNDRNDRNNRNDRNDRSDRNSERKADDRRDDRRDDRKVDEPKAPEKSAEELQEEKKAEMEYAARVEQQMKKIEEEKKFAQPETAEERRRKRQAVLDRYKSTPSASSAAAPTAVEVAARAEKEKEVEVVRNGGDEKRSGPPAPAAAAPAITDDIFAPGAGLIAGATVQHATENLSLTDNWDDAEGYYKFRPGDMLDGRYEVFASQGRGVFSTVLRVRDKSYGDRELVVKVIRNNETMYKAGLKELDFLKTLSAKDPEGTHHVIRLLGHFEHKNHLCLVFEPMNLNLREVLKKYGGIGLRLGAVRMYAKQLFRALKHLKRCNILHGDIKPDNILVNEKHGVLKLCDFGSASSLGVDCEITPYLVSRFYRAPEIILGLPYDDMVDVWSVGCCLYELYTGKILFQGKDNNQMLEQAQEVKGAFPNKLIRKAQFRAMHFDENYQFLNRRTDALTGSILTSKVKFTNKPPIDLRALLDQGNLKTQKLSDAERTKLDQLADFILKCLELNPARRMTAKSAFDHPFLKDE